MPVTYIYLSVISTHMAQGSKQSILRELLGRIDSGDFKYERREKIPTNWHLYDQAQISEINGDQSKFGALRDNLPNCFYPDT